MNIKSMLGLQERDFILASSSPRRKQLFELIGLDFRVQQSDFDESQESFTVPEVQVLELSHKKAAKVAETIKDGIVIGADTVVVLQNRILGKPDSPSRAREMLRTLSGKTHTVITGYAVIEKPGGFMHNDYQRTEVTFRELTDEEIDAYVATGMANDKAGSYGIQDQGALFVKEINGCFYNVMGFPLTKFYSTLCSLSAIAR